MNISVIIPAFNEEGTVGDVVMIAANSSLVQEVLVISDGSTDATAVMAAGAGARVIELKENLGKGAAMMVGVQQSKGDILVFLDADLIGFKEIHLLDLITPLIEGKAEMSVGVFDKGRKVTDFAQFIAPFLSGQRAVKRIIINQMSHLDATRFGIEMALTKYVHDHDLRMEEVELRNLSHVMKEEKLGLWKGFMARMKMYWEIARYMSGTYN